MVCMHQTPHGRRGFTLIELLVVMVVIGLLVAIVSPRYIQHIDHAKDTALKQNLLGMRESIDKFYADRARYPKSLEELVQFHYLRQVPVDPITDRSDTWVLVPATPDNTSSRDGGIVNVRSGALGAGKEGTPYAAM